MKATIRQIGNSKGVIIPASFLAQSGLSNEVEMKLVDDSILISPVKKTPRAGWFANYDATQDQDVLQGYVATDGEDSEWQW